MGKLQFDDPRTSRRIEMLIRREVKREVTRQVAQPRRGTVVAVDLDARDTTVRFVRPGGFDDEHHIAILDFVPRLEQEVLVMRLPDTGEAYIDHAVDEDVLVRRLTELGLITEGT